MWLFDAIKTRVKKWTDTVIDTTAKVGNYMEEKWATLMEKVPGGHNLKEKAATYTEKAVDRVGSETKEMIKEWQWFIDSHMKKDTKTVDTTASISVAVVEPIVPVVEKAHVEEKKTIEKKHTESKKSHPHKKK